METKNKQYQGKFSKSKETAPKKKEPFRRKWRRFVRKVKHNSKYQIALYLVLCILISLFTRVHQSHRDKVHYTEMMETQKAEIVAEYEQKIAELQSEHELSIDAMRAEYENLTPEELLKQEAEYIAKVLYGIRNNSERDLRTAIWCILNRVDHPNYPNTVKEVCEQKSQWMGYDDSNPVLNSLYELAMKELTTWHSDYRPVNIDYVYMSWSSKEITLRNTWEVAKNTRYWQAA